MEYFPPEINYNILSRNHPFYNYKRCREIPVQCNEIGYEILQTWIWPLLSTNEIQNMLPNITYDDVVALSLIYNPIPESIRYYDSLHLLYYACERNSEDVISFVIDIPSKYYLLVGNIALKYGRNEIIHLLLTRTDIDNKGIRKLEFLDYMIRVKNGQKNLKFFEPFTFNDLILPIAIWSWEELAENIVILSILYPTFTPALSALFGLNRVNTPAVINSIYYQQAYEIAGHVNNVPDILERYERKFPSTLNKLLTLDVNNSQFLIDYRNSLLPKDTYNSGKFYIESGMYAEYIDWRNAGNTLDKDDNVPVGVSILGVPSRNLEYIAVYGGTLNE